MKRTETRIAIATKGGLRFAYERIVEEDTEPRKEIEQPTSMSLVKRIDTYA